MAYRNKFGITKIINKQYNSLSISCGAAKLKRLDDQRQRKPVFLFVPNQENPEHYHIELNRKQAKVLHKWLKDYLSNT